MKRGTPSASTEVTRPPASAARVSYTERSTRVAGDLPVVEPGSPAQEKDTAATAASETLGASFTRMPLLRGGCAHPIEVRGRSATVHATTGEIDDPARQAEQVLPDGKGLPARAQGPRSRGRGRRAGLDHGVIRLGQVDPAQRAGPARSLRLRELLPRAATDEG